MHHIFTAMILIHAGAFCVLGGVTGSAFLTRLHEKDAPLPKSLFYALGLVWGSGVALVIMRWGDFTLFDTPFWIKLALSLLISLGVSGAAFKPQHRFARLYLPITLLGSFGCLILSII